ncbi:hypothetical protein V9T40_001863 [Parthenolecanium corni]|uniref:Uncharacterized protein n=1 Tax=Parthenolecanium corni TaxID=536013 RepID=A0AAN9Y4T1_9HEMI
MANLDDFFKKKDNKKTKGKKFAVSNPLSLTSKEPVKNGKVKQEKPTSYNPSNLPNENDLFSSQYGDEWKEFVEEEKKDYSGLKIQNLQINDEENEKQKAKQESEEEVEIDDNGQTVKKKPAGPWKKIQEQKVAEAPPPAEVEPPKPEKVEPSTYVAPYLRKMNNEKTSRTYNLDCTIEKRIKAVGSSLIL